MENQQNDSNTLIAWVIGAAVTGAIAIAFIFSAVAVNSSGPKAETPAAPAAAPAASASDTAPADQSADKPADKPSEPGQAPSDATPAQSDAAAPKSN
ncbi:MAG: hypothetical protein RIS35_3556 [Pseudomonadota bacterium]|jgi:cytoskeletal protein RodZ